MAKLRSIKPVLTEKDIVRLGKEYDEISSQIKLLDKKKKELAEQIKEGAEKYGVKDDKGSYYLDSDEFILGKVAKKSMKLDQEKAKEVLESLGLGDVIDSTTIYTVNEQKLEQAVLDNRIDMKTVGSFTNTSVSFSVSVKAKEIMPEVEQTTLMAAKKK